MNTLYLSSGWTLVDITNTDVVTYDSVSRNQQRNWETVIQVLGLRTQLMLLRPPTVIEVDVSTLHFGSAYKGKHKVWEFKFGIEFEAVFAGNDRPYGTLENDFVNVPIITGLTETATIHTPTFIVAGEQTNIFFETLSL